MSAAIKPAHMLNARSTFPWPKLFLLHLHLKGRTTAVSHTYGAPAAVGQITARTHLPSAYKATTYETERAKAQQAGPAEDSKHALNAFLAAFRDAYKRKRSAKCLQLVLDYASSLPRDTGGASQPTSDPARELPFTSSKSAVISGRGQQLQQSRSNAAGRPRDVQPSQGSFSLSPEAKRHLSHVLKGRHQELMKMLIADGNADGAIQYVHLLPPSRELCSCLMKECSAASDLPGLQKAIEVLCCCLVHLQA